jgi:hypothetical protein
MMRPSALELAKPRSAERRITLRLYKMWDVARGQRAFPVLADFDLSHLERLGSDSFLLDLNGTPRFRYFGRNLVTDIGRDLTGRPISEVPPFTLLSQVIADCTESALRVKPVGLSGSFIKAVDHHLLYRGILLPISIGGFEVDGLLGAFRYREAKGVLVRAEAKSTQREAAGVVTKTTVTAPTVPVETRATISRVRHLFEDGFADEPSAPNWNRRIGILIASCWRRVLFPPQMLRLAKSAPTIGRTVLVQDSPAEFVLLLARKVEPGRFEVISTANSLLLNLGMRVALRTTVRRSRHQQASTGAGHHAYSRANALAPRSRSRLRRGPLHP